MGPPTKGRWLWGEEEASIPEEPPGEAGPLPRSPSEGDAVSSVTRCGHSFRLKTLLLRDNGAEARRTGSRGGHGHRTRTRWPGKVTWKNS